MQKNSTTISQKLDVFLKTSQNKSYFIALMTFLFFVFFMLFGVIPAYNSVFSQIDENSKIEVEFANAKEKLASFQSMSTELQSNQKLFEYFNKIFPESDLQKDILKDLGDRVKNFDLNILSIQFPEKYIRSVPVQLNFPGLTPQIKPLQVTLTLEGNRTQMLSLLKDVESARRIYSVTNLAIIRKSDEEVQDDPERREFSMQLDLEYFIFNPIVEAQI